MTHPINLFSISRIHDATLFNVLETHQSRKEKVGRHGYQEIESLRLLVDKMIHDGIEIQSLDNFFFGYSIPRIGKEFDLLKFTDVCCLNIELKSENVSTDKICQQLRKNRHYLKHLDKALSLFCVVTDTMCCFRLTSEDKLEIVDFSEVLCAINEHKEGALTQIDEMFSAKRYLVSPMNTPDKFIRDEYFLTQAQESIKKELLSEVAKTTESGFFHITGKPGTGKTLLLYDIAKTLAKLGSTVIIHCAKLSSGQVEISKEIEGLTIASVSLLKDGFLDLVDYKYILVDESHRFHLNQFDKLCHEVEENGQICIFSSDSEQVLSDTEIRRDIVGKIRSLGLLGDYVLPNGIRMNQELISFILQLRNLRNRPKTRMEYPNIDLNYTNTTAEAQTLIEYYREKGYTFINYSSSNYNISPYDQYRGDYDTHHVIGQECDNVVMLLDKSFFYSEEGELKGIIHPNPDYLYPNLFYQGITRVREKIALIVVDNPELMKCILSIVESEIG